MSETKFTPKPWKAEQPTMPRKLEGVEIWSDGMLVAQVAGLAGFDYANGDLIAAAPELYEAAVACVKFYDAHGGPMADLRKAIAKAEGKE